MEYLTLEEYKQLGGTKDVSPFVFINEKEKIDELTFNRIVDATFDKLTEFQKNQIKRTVFLLVEYYMDNPEILEDGLGISNYRVGDINVTINTNSASQQILEQYGVPLNVYKSLSKTGLTRRGI